MTKKRIKNVQTCSACNKTGHNKRRCAEVTSANLKFVFQKKKKSNFSLNTAKKKQTLIKKNRKISAHIFVNTHSEPEVSEHFIDLRKEKSVNMWSGVSAFREKDTPVDKKRLTIDFAGMVREANKEVRKSESQKVRKSGTLFFVNKKIFKRKKMAVPLFLKDLRFKFSIRAKNLFLQRLSIDKNLCQSKSFVADYFNTLFSIIGGFFISLRNFFFTRKFAYGALVFLLVLSLPFPAIGYYNKVKENSARIVDASSNAFLALQSSTLAALHSNIGEAQEDLNQALDLFSQAESIIDREHVVLVYITSLLPFIGRQMKDRQYLLNAGHHIALGNTYLVKGIGEAEKIQDVSMTERFQILKRHLKSARPQYEEALKSLVQINNASIPLEYQQSFEDFKLLFTVFIDDMNDFVDLIDMTYVLFGGDNFQRTLVLFQNQHELRPSGGFLGSFAIIDTQKGKILNIEVPGGGSYDLQGQLTEYVAPPLPLQLVNDRWEFQDSNWFFDFPATAKNAEWFVERSKGITFDNVIAVNASVIERLLSVVGVIENEKYDILLDANNVLDKLQYSVEIDYDKEENKPKQVLADLLTQFLDLGSSLDGQKILRLLGEFNQALNQKEIQIYSHDKNTQDRLSQFGWTGEILPTIDGQDYLAVVNANLQGQKSDGKIIQHIDHQTVVLEDGSIEDTIKITRQHTGLPGEMFYGSPNIDYIRVYVPEGAVLLDASGFEYPPENAFHVPESWYDDPKLDEVEDGYHSDTGTRVSRQFGKTVFGNWVIVKPGETTEVFLTYRLPFSVITDHAESSDNTSKWTELFLSDYNTVSKYQMLVQRQSGSESFFSSKVVYPEYWELQWKTEEDAVFDTNFVSFEKTLENDFSYSLVMKKNN